MWAEPPPALFEQALACLLQHYESYNGHRTAVYPEAGETLARLKAAGIRLCCITNKKRRFSEPLLADLQLLAYFDFLVCGDDLPVNKPDPLTLRHAMQRAETGPDETLMVGDSVTDVKTARAAGVRVVAVSYGYNHGEDIRAAGPDWVVDSLAGICTIAGLPE
jgi:phosphoglycolate phosphatase